MGTVKEFGKIKLITGILSTLSSEKGYLKERLTREFGPVDYESPEFDFTFTDYYDLEMGKNIKRFFWSFSDLIQPDLLPDIKLKTNDIEKEFTEKGNRKINIDPGLLSLSSLILATTKNNVHRIPLQKGIYGETTLLYINREFKNLPWTYPDYSSAEYHKIFEEIRKILKKDLKRR